MFIEYLIKTFKFKFIQIVKTKFKFINLANIEFKFKIKFINNSWADSNLKIKIQI